MDVSLRDYVDSRLAEQEKRWVDRFNAAQRAVDSSAAQMDRRLEGMNEFREAIKDQANRMATKEELQSLANIVRDLQMRSATKENIETLNGDIKSLQLAKSNLDGRLFIIGSGAGTVAGILASLLVMWLMF